MNPITSSTREIMKEPTDNTKISEPATFSTNSVKKFINAIETKRWKKLRLTLGDGSLVNTLVKGPKSYAGITLLQIASILSSEKTVEILINEYHADVNVKNKDGIQLIQWACLHHRGTLVGILLDAGANLNATIRKDLFLARNKGQVKHPKRIWHDQFGDEVTIPEFAVLYDDFSSIAKCLTERNIEINLANPMGGNKTLLMYAMESKTTVRDPLLQMYKDLGLLNVRDDDGIPATHYLLHPKIYGNFRYDQTQFEMELDLGFSMRYLLDAGVDVHATINEDPDTLLINMASYRSSYEMLKELLPYYDYITESKALYYATLPVGDLKTSFRVNEDHGDFPMEHQEYLQRQRKKCIELIVEDLINRCAFGLPVPQSEREIMDDLVAIDSEIRDEVRNYETKIIEGFLKHNIIDTNNRKKIDLFGLFEDTSSDEGGSEEICCWDEGTRSEERISLYDFIRLCCNEKKVKLLVKNKPLMDAFEKLDLAFSQYYYFERFIGRILKRTRERIELLEKLEKIVQLLDAIPLPYELILDIVEYLDNINFENFIAAFYENV